MILSEDFLQSLLDQALKRVEARPDVTVVLEGSIAEGFGNTSSDIDFLFIEDNDAAAPTMPSILFVEGRRVEVRTRSLRQVCDQLDEVRQAAARGPRHAARLSEDLLNRCQRLLRSFRLRGPELTERFESHLGHQEFADVMAGWWAHYARQSVRQAVALSALGQHEDAAGWAQSGLVQSVKAWAAGRGETYLEPKWLSMQLERLSAPGNAAPGNAAPGNAASNAASGSSAEDSAILAKRYWSLETRTASGLAPDAYVSDCVELAADLGIRGCGSTPSRLTVERARDVTTWQTGDRVHVLRAKRDVFALGPAAGQVWRAIVFGQPLPAVLAAAEAAGVPEPGELLASFLRTGLCRLSWRGGGPVVPTLPLAATPGPITPPPSALRPPLTVGGAEVTGDRAVDLVAVPAERFVAAGMTLVWSNVLIENAREDFAGAHAREQWRVAELTLRRVVQVALRGLLSAYGVHPLPPDSDLLRRLTLLPADGSGPAEVRRAAGALEAAEITSPAEAERVRSELDAFVTLIRQATGAAHFPSSFHSAEGWQTTLDIGHDWLRMGAYLNAELPIDEARDLLASGGAQPHVAGSSRR